MTELEMKVISDTAIAELSRLKLMRDQGILSYREHEEMRLDVIGDALEKLGLRREVPHEAPKSPSQP